ncbi:hypothetical protein LK994_14075 [Ferruginibacter lapsinanis]|uniref:hypothetical protein n=1 Tax=Ferruginibacter lapsinanis TaxID=563172 RepID=UPI001E625986|nr:hypothetical protein [Ferruginibacter lapsinanis]UEG49764.1 hypothetical protein LK994_14075 [Ferruginibacter lapsinanis]
MKKISSLICCILICAFVSAQTQSNMKEYLLTKSKHHKTVAWVLVGAGSAAIITGLIYNSSHKEGSFEQNFTGGFIIASGLICAGASIPYFISANSKKKRAASLAFGKQSILTPVNNVFCLTTQPAVFLRIPISR